MVLSGTVGSVLDPVFSLRRRVRLAPNTSAVLAFGTALAADRNEAVTLARRFSDLAEVERTFQQSRTHSQATLVALGISPDDAALFHRLAAHVLFTGPALRSRESVVGNRLGQSGLWPCRHQEICPSCWRDSSLGQSNLVETVRAHAYWRRSGLVVDLVLLHDANPADELHDSSRNWCAWDRPPRWRQARRRVPSGAQRVPADAMLLEAAAGPSCGGGPIAEQLERAPVATLPPDLPVISRHNDAHHRQAERHRPEAVVLERPGRVHAGRPRVPDRHRRGADAAAGPVDQRARQPRLRLPGHRGRRATPGRATAR